MPSDRSASDDEVEDAYHEYLWGESSPRSFARKAQVVGANGGARRRAGRQASGGKVSRRIEVVVDADVDVSRYV